MTAARRPRKRLGQHFLTDRAVVGRLVSAFAPAPGQRIVEIGPGRGALTGALLECVAHLTVVELDRGLAQLLQKRYPPHRVTVIHADILDFNLSDAAPADVDAGAPRLRLIGNLPYNISTPLIFHLLEQIEWIEDMQFMLQKEVAQRLCAAPGGRNYGRLSVMAAMQIHCAPLFEVPPQAFHPPPKVDSTALRLAPKTPPLQARDRRMFSAVVAAAFAQRRKTLRNALAALAGREHFARAGVDPALRAEALSVEQYIALADAVCWAAS
ncbi:MAG: 16S rRNA (adenine(1518)-N(6)/adenine(1519)-N(6))-dimethyltransferase RsmA [Gammaproteobacteria bacterium]|nr:16S rRNA (adenine(1518)-N(6)/adenine(1519)-N(6))-dimethyltransferase RsmA [Gammaproteobacteria bacterium]